MTQLHIHYILRPARYALLAASMVGLTRPASAQQLTSAEIASIDSVFARFDHTWSPGCAMGVVRRGRLVFSRGYGMANLEHNIALTDRSVFRIGSVSKQFTAAAIALLAQDGALALDDDVRRFIPELPEYGHRVTIRHFLNHTSGIRDYLTVMYLAGYRDDDWYTNQDVIDILVQQNELNFDPGDEYLYSNAGYFLLSVIVERASGQSLREFAAARMFEPLGMMDSHFQDDHTYVVPQRATGYAPTRDGTFRISMTTLDMVGDGGVFTTVQDLAKWDHNFYTPTVGGQRLLGDMHTQAVLNDGDTLTYALGLGVTEYRGLEVVQHGGAFVGFRAQLMRFPTQQLSVICLCNLSATNPTRLSHGVVDILLGDLLAPREDRTAGGGEQPEEATSSVASPPTSELRQFTGRYYAPELDATYEITLESDSLNVSVGNDIDGVLEFLGDDRFDRDGIVFRFQRAGDRIIGFRLDAGRVKNLWFEKQ